MTTIPTPVCHGMHELPSAAEERASLNQRLLSGDDVDFDALPPTLQHIALGLALTTGSALGQRPPAREECLAAFVVPNSAGLGAGARAWTKHAHRSEGVNADADADADEDEDEETVTVPVTDKKSSDSYYSGGWWGRAQGPVDSLNAGALELFDRIVQNASWRNLHWLPHMVLVYEVRIAEGYGMRWSQAQDWSIPDSQQQQNWIFRGFVEPMMASGHERRWRH